MIGDRSNNYTMEIKLIARLRGHASTMKFQLVRIPLLNVREYYS